jgi:riboflavin kinase/FMN adenylyltransferase
MHTLFAQKIGVSQTVAIGNFDGGHRGHQALLQKLCQVSKSTQTASTVITFEPLTCEFFAAQKPRRLMNLRDKTAWVKAQGVDNMLCIPFTNKIATLSATDFIQQYLLANRVVQVVIGEDFRFGAGRQGTPALLAARGLLTTLLPPVIQEGRVSSSQIREFLMAGQFQQAEQALGRPYRLSGVVQYGSQRGRLLGFPTANIALNRYLPPLSGVYQVRVLVGGVWYNGAANIGVRPTVDGTRSLCEVHILNFHQTVYGKRLVLEPLRKIREEKRFDSLEQLKAQIGHDIATLS